MAVPTKDARVSVMAKCSFGAPGFCCEKGDAIEVPLADARRMIQRGLAAELKDSPLPRASDDDAEAARVVEVETVEVTGQTWRASAP